jgi:hypothetical protein
MLHAVARFNALFRAFRLRPGKSMQHGCNAVPALLRQLQIEALLGSQPRNGTINQQLPGDLG